MPEAPVPQGGGDSPAPGGGVAEAITQADATLSKLAQMSAENGQLSDGAKQAIAAALDAFRAFQSEITGGGEQASATVPQEAGPRGVPVSHGRPA